MPSSTAKLKADTVGVKAHERLGGGLWGAFVHSSYEGAVNITTALGIISLVPASAGRGPINITFGTDFRLLSSSVAANDPVTVDAETISIGSGIPLSLAGSRVYNPSQRFLRPVLGLKLIRQNILLARETAFIQGKFAGMGSLLHSMRGELLVASKLGLSEYSRRALPPLRALIGGLAENDLKRVRAAAKNIAGLGVGLTPSGDDLLSGLLVVLVLSTVNGIPTGFSYCRAAKAIAESAVDQSGALGQEFIEQASVGRANEKVTKLVEDIFTGTPPEVEASASDLIAMGHSSGTDTLVGVVVGVGFVLQNMSRAAEEEAKGRIA